MNNKRLNWEPLQYKSVLFVDNSPAIQKRVKAELERYVLKISMCETAFDIPEWLDEPTNAFDIVILDLFGMTKGERNFIPNQDVQPLTERYPDMPFLIYSNADDDHILQYEFKGPRGFILRHDGIEELLNGMMHVLIDNNIHFYFSRSIPLDKRLSFREYEALVDAGNGHTAQQAARIRHLSKSTIEEYRGNACRKLGANSITHAVKIAKEEGII